MTCAGGGIKIGAGGATDGITTCRISTFDEQGSQTWQMGQEGQTVGGGQEGA